ncbi:MAG: 30S ribosomal protein S6 [Alphaproteobacteria bacterium]|nr:30S ribosomal protein S6 [Alphaproteobacteria bacterium]
MANYESVLITRQDLTPTQVSEIVSSLSDSIAKNGGQVVRVDSWGLKNLAYRIKKNRKGYYTLLNITAPAVAVAEYQRLLKLNEDVIRFMTIKVEEFGKEITSSSKESEE